MKAYGLRSKLRYQGYQDRRPHPHRKYINWWEDEIDKVKSKKSERFRAKREIKNEKNYIYNLIYGDD